LILQAFWVLPAHADDEPLESLGLTERQPDIQPLLRRAVRPTSQIAENSTVITATDIERLNAHTLADVLQTVPGIQLDNNLRTPTVNSGFFNIQGALSTTVLVLIDGIRQNDYEQNTVWVNTIPLQQVERIEIIKGSASAAWGQALGGVINVVTKTPNPDKQLAGTISASTGTRFTADSRAELSGTQDRFGYYFTAGNIRSDGLSPNTATNLTTLYGKTSYQLPTRGVATFGLSYLTVKAGMDEGDIIWRGNPIFVHDNIEYRRTNGFLTFNQPLGQRLSLDIDGYLTNRDDYTKWGGRDDSGAIIFFNNGAVQETSRGANTRLTWGDSQQNITAGFDYAHIQASSKDLLSSDPPVYDKSWDRWAVYANSAYKIGPVTILPGVRHDNTGTSGNSTSYTLGATCQLTSSTTLRGYTARGFTLPTLYTGSNDLQKIRTVQAGVESGAIPYLWLKGTYFYNTLRNSQSAGVVPVTSDQNREGFEIEARTTPLYGVSLTSGYTYLYATNSDTGERLQTDSSQSVPPHTVKLALNYDNTDHGLRGALTGNYVWWNSPAGYPSQSSGMIWDLHLNWKLKPVSGLEPELFFSGHNLFNNIQTTDTTLYTNARRWFDGGLRVNF
jgi:vitamin B12 transporter